MSKWVTGLLMAAPLSLSATPLSLRVDGFYHLDSKEGVIAHKWKNSLVVKTDKKIVVDRIKKKSCVGGDCNTFELITEITARNLPDDVVLFEVEFTNTSDGGVTSLSGEGKMINHQDIAQIELKSKSSGSEHFGLNLVLR